MGYAVRVLADSVSGAGRRITTLAVTFPRFVLAEFNTHRMLSRNSASSRAIPVSKMIERVVLDPVLPVWWGKAQPGMQAREELDEPLKTAAVLTWLAARDKAVEAARVLEHLGVHKQITNRVLEPWLWHTAIVTATEWQNFLALRCHVDAQPEIREAALMMRASIADSQPVYMPRWHLPLVPDREELSRELDEWTIARVCSARCARVSYLTHDGKRDVQADIDLADRLHRSGHMSPFEHPAIECADGDMRFGNFTGWQQYRGFLPNEAVFQG